MPTRTPAEFIADIKGSGLFVVRNDDYYFVPLKTMTDCLLPKEFQRDPGLDVKNIFEQINGGNQPAALTAAMVHSGIDRKLSELRVADGINQAIWVAEEENTANGKKVSVAESSKSVLFEYSADGKKIVVDMSKGGKPSGGA
jgi:hypothetical protein